MVTFLCYLLQTNKIQKLFPEFKVENEDIFFEIAQNTRQTTNKLENGKIKYKDEIQYKKTGKGN